MTVLGTTATDAYFFPNLLSILFFLLVGIKVIQLRIDGILSASNTTRRIYGPAEVPCLPLLFVLPGEQAGANVDET